MDIDFYSKENGDKLYGQVTKITKNEVHIKPAVNGKFSGKVVKFKKLLNK